MASGILKYRHKVTGHPVYTASCPEIAPGRSSGRKIASLLFRKEQLPLALLFFSSSLPLPLNSSILQLFPVTSTYSSCTVKNATWLREGNCSVAPLYLCQHGAHSFARFLTQHHQPLACVSVCKWPATIPVHTKHTSTANSNTVVDKTRPWI